MYLFYWKIFKNTICKLPKFQPKKRLQEMAILDAFKTIHDNYITK
jgi:hypothetical protein